MKKTNNTEVIKHRYNRYSKFYDFFEAPMEIFFGKWRKEIVRHASGKVLEVGVGTGKNIKCYNNDID
ncbi:MAG: hypothetical protein Q7S39_09150 [Ignavibacteria bacterium]|nr:hypothetical protein [Ignavibacteria bacterium]